MCVCCVCVYVCVMLLCCWCRRGYARWNEILADTRFALLTLPFKEQGDGGFLVGLLCWDVALVAG